MAVQTLGVEEDVRRLLHTPPYIEIFIISEPTYEELVCEFYATFELNLDKVSLRLGGIDRVMDMVEFDIALGV